MPDILPSEYIDVLRIAYHHAEKYYNQAVADVIAAEVRRDEAKKIKEEALTRLEDAREKYETPEVKTDSTTKVPPSTEDTTTTTATTNVPASADSPSTNDTTTSATTNVPASADKRWADTNTTITATTDVSASTDSPRSNTTTPTPTTNVLASTDNRPPMSPKRNNSFNNGEKKVVRRKPIKKAIAESSRRLQEQEKVEESVVNPKNEDIQEASPREQRQSIAPPDIILSPTAGRKKPPKIFLTNPESPGLLSPTTGYKKSAKIFLTNPESPRRRSTSLIAQLYPMDEIKGVLAIAQGRNRDWFDKNFDCEVHGLVKRFFQATFGTKTNEKTKKVTVKTIVLNDEGNELVTDTSQMQEMYIGASPDNDSKPTFRDRAAEALVNPPQQDPIALFFAPKRTLNTNEIYYGGHWKVLDGEMLQPPRLVRGQPQQCLARFTFVGIDRQMVEAINKGI